MYSDCTTDQVCISPRSHAMVWTPKRICFLLTFISFSVILWFNLGKLFDSHEAWCLRNLQGCGSVFGPEKGNYSFTVVTGLLDIGRGQWWMQARSYREYLGFLLKVLKLDVNLVVYIEPKGSNFVKTNRRGRESRTVIHTVQVPELEYFPLLPRIKEIMNSEEFKRDNANLEEKNCEALVPLYNLVTNCKIGMVHRAIRENPFGSDYFVWMDGGFGHGESEEKGIFPPDGIWNPQQLLNHPDRVTFTALEELPREGEKPEKFYKRNKAWIAGGLYGGGAQAMETYYHLHDRIFHEYLDQGIVDDDQTILLECYLRNQSNFRPVKGSWYDLMRPFS